MRCHHATSGNVCLIAMAAIIAGCAGNGNGLDANGRPLTGAGAGADAPLTADFDSIQEHIFTPICSVCHVGGSAPQGLRLDSANSYSLTVGVASTEVPGIERIKPGDPDNSYLVQKLEGHAAVGARMPFGGPYLSTDTVAIIRQWISDGALASASANAHGVASALALMSMTPDYDETQTQPVSQVVLVFNHELDVSRLDASQVHLEQLNRDGDALPLAAHLTVAQRMPHAFLIWPDSPLSTGRYRVSIAAGAVQDLSGEQLEELRNTFDIQSAP